jgi:DNA-binding HxlR family transcriptional regulator
MPLNRGYANMTCSVADALEVVGERWTLLIVRELLLGVHRFDEIQRDLGIARNVLQTRLGDLVDQSLVSRTPYQSNPPRYDYRLTEVGLELWPVVVSLMQWGDRHRSHADGPPVTLSHRGCGGGVDGHLCCDRCGARLGPRDVWAEPGAGAPADHPLRRRREAPAGA